MEADFIVSVSGLEESGAQVVGEVLAATAGQLERSCGLDLRRLHRVLVAADYDSALQGLSSQTLTGQIIRTDEDYARGLAKMVTLHGDGNPEIVVAMEAGLGALLATVVNDSEAAEFRFGLHLLHHELCHVHDMNRMLDAFREEMFRPRGDRKYAVVQPLGFTCWEEYSANKRCSSTVNEEALSMMTGNLLEAVGRTKPMIDGLVIEYRTHQDVDRLMAEFDRHGGFLLRSAAYVLGYMDGLGVPLQEVSGPLCDALTGSYFEPAFFDLADQARAVDALPRERWHSLDIFNPLGEVVDRYYSLMGLDLELLDDGQLYVSIPFRPDNTPDL